MLTRPIELVLTMLLESFKFEAGPEVDWLMSGIARPALKNSTDKASQLPLKISLLKN